VACNCKPSVFHNVGPTANCPATSDKHYNVNSMAAARDLECNAPSVTSRCLRATASLTQSHGIVADSASNFARTHLSSVASTDNTAVTTQRHDRGEMPPQCPPNGRLNDLRVSITADVQSPRTISS